MRSVLQDNKECFVCAKTYDLECHHIFRGAYRRKSENYGLKVWLCHEHHTGNKGVHNGNVAVDRYLKELAQRKFEETYSREKFIETFGRSYL